MANVKQRLADEWPILPSNPVKALLAVKRVIRSTAVLFMREFRDVAATKAAQLKVAISVLRSATAAPSASHARPAALQASALRAPGLREALVQDSDLKSLSPSFEHVERHVAALFTANPRADPMSMRKPNFLNTAKATLPTKGLTFTNLHLPHGDERDTVRMAAALKEHWGPLWTRDNPTPAVISDYLSSYTKRLDPIPSVSLESVLTVLAERRDSSIGPDGIPFSVYRLFADIVAPLFLRVFRHASLAVTCRRLVNRSFNFVNIPLICSFSRRITPTPLPTSVRSR